MTVNVEELVQQTRAVLQRVANGEEVVIADGGQPVARLTAIPKKHPKRELGTHEGKIWIADDFDETPEEFAEYM